jgi:hypothetical protein
VGRIVLANAFSLQMLPRCSHELDFSPIDLDMVRGLVFCNECYSVVGHEATARLLSELLGVTVAYNRERYILSPGDCVVCAVLRDRIPEGKVLSKEEIQAVGIDWWMVSFA